MYCLTRSTSFYNAELLLLIVVVLVPNPCLELAEEAVELGNARVLTYFLGHRWRTVMDSAKAIAYGLANDVSLEDLICIRSVFQRQPSWLFLLLQELI